MADRQAYWQKIYQDKSPLEVSWYQNKPELSLELIRRSGLRPDEAIIDIGGGASCLVDYLIRAGYTSLSVLDISAHALDSAKARLGELAYRVQWFESDITAFASPHSFQLWHDRAVFHFLTRRTDRKKYLEVLEQTLRPGGFLIMASFAIGGPEKCSGLDIVQYDAGGMMEELGEGFTLLELREEVHMTPVNREQKFSYFRFLRNPV